MTKELDTQKSIALGDIRETLLFCPGCASNNIATESTKNNISSCSECGLIFTNPRPTEYFIQHNYCSGGYYEKFIPDENWRQMWLRRISRITKRLRSGDILDISAGVGTSIHMLNEIGFKANGTEISTEAIARARQLYGIELRKVPPNAIEIADNSLDALTMWHVFEHFSYPGQVLSLLAKKLKLNGLIFIAVPNNSFHMLIFRPKLWFASRQKQLEALISDVPYEKTFSEIHLIHFTPKSLKKIVESNGFEILELSMDNISLKPGLAKDLKYGVRNFLAKHFGLYTHKALFLCARKISG